MDLIDPHTFNMMDQDSEGRIIPATSAREIRNLRINEYSKQGARVGMKGTKRVHNETFDFDSLGDNIVEVNPLVFATIKYGAMYNWHTAVDVRGIAADGWHIQTQSEWAAFQSYVSYGTGGGKLKKTGDTYWVAPNVGATDEYGFGAKGSGFRSSAGSFSLITERCYFWSVTTNTFNTNNSYCVYMINFDDIFPITDINKKSGLSLRPVKDSTSLVHGQSGVYIGNDGKAYPSICIGGIEYLADTLFETKFRTGELIPVVSDNSAWAALTTAGMCYYENDINNA